MRTRMQHSRRRLIHRMLKEREENEQFKQENPQTALGLEVVGSLATGGLAGGTKITAAKTLPAAALQSAKTGTVLGATAGARRIGGPLPALQPRAFAVGRGGYFPHPLVLRHSLVPLAPDKVPEAGAESLAPDPHSAV